MVTSLRAPVGRPHPIESILLIPSGGGVFDVFVDDKRVFSKHESHRHADPKEIEAIVKKLV